MPNAATLADGTLVAERDGIPSLSSSLLARPSRSTSAADEAGDLLCKKGTAAATRWRAYDHKEVFEPARGAVAPPSDADELGSWSKYEESLPASTVQTSSLADEERPTSWSKYETKPLASLLGSSEKLRQKPSIHLSGSEPPAEGASTSPATRAPGDHGSPTAEIEPTPPPQTAAVETSSTLTEVASAADTPGGDVEPETEIATASIEEDALDKSPLWPAPDMAVPAPAIADAGNRPYEPLDAAQPATMQPNAPAAEMQDSVVDIAELSTPAPPMDELANVEQDIDASVETALAAFDGALSMLVGSLEVEPVCTADTALQSEPHSADGSEADDSGVSQTLSAIPLEQSAPAEGPEAPAEAPTPIPEAAKPADDATPVQAQKPTLVVAPEVDARSSAKNAMLARLAAMLGQALATEHTAGTPESLQPAPSLDAFALPPAAVEPPPMPETSGAVETELPSAQLPDVREQALETLPPELSQAAIEVPSCAFSDLHASPEGLEEQGVEPTVMLPESGALDVVASQVELHVTDLLQPYGEKASEPAAVSAVEIDSGPVPTAEMRGAPEGSALAADPIGDEPVAKPSSNLVGEAATSGLELGDQRDSPSDPLRMPPRAKKAALAQLVGMLERALSRKRSAEVPGEPAPAHEVDEPAPATVAPIEAAPAANEGPTIVSAVLAPEPIKADAPPVLAEVDG
ncbi:MAG: hypothetical protein ACREFI_04335, partial [Stellaceae bacterium]